MARTPEKEPKKQIVLPIGRMINGSLFERDAFNDKAEPAYKIEVAFDEIPEALEDEIFEEVAKGHKLDFDKVIKLYESGDLKTPFLDGDKLASKREKKGKPGDAYKGKTVIRAKTKYDRNGSDSTNEGVAVYDEEVNLLEKVSGGAAQIYNGCYVQPVVTVNTYETDDGDYAFSFYLVAVQKTGDGEKLTSPADHSNLFKPVGRQASGGGRRRASSARRLTSTLWR